MVSGHLARRLFHLSAPAFLIYYVLPEDFLTIGRQNFVFIIFGLVMALEIYRLARGEVFFGMRDYEANQLSAYGWAAIGLTLAYVFFPQIFVIPALFGIGWIDPLIGEMRRRKMKGYPLVPLLAYFILTFSCLFIFSGMLDIDFTVPMMLMLASAASVVAITVEKPTLKHLDDDFLMLIFPLITLTVLYEFLQMTGFL